MLSFGGRALAAAKAVPPGAGAAISCLQAQQTVGSRGCMPWLAAAGPEVVNWTIRADKSQVMVMVANRSVIETACTASYKGEPPARAVACRLQPSWGCDDGSGALTVAAGWRAHGCAASIGKLPPTCLPRSVRLPPHMEVRSARHPVLLEGVVSRAAAEDRARSACRAAAAHCCLPWPVVAAALLTLPTQCLFFPRMGASPFLAAPSRTIAGSSSSLATHGAGTRFF